MIRPGHIVVRTRPGETFAHVPSHIDCAHGRARPTCFLDDGPIDRALRRDTSAFRAARVFHARGSLHEPGCRHLGFDDLEQELGLARTYRVELADDDPTVTRDTVRRLRDLLSVESATVQTLATAPLLIDDRPPSVEVHHPAPKEVDEPHEVVHAAAALELEPGDAEVVVAVVDTGVSLDHPEFRGRLMAGYDTVDLGIGRVGEDMRLVGDSWGRDHAPDDGTGHGSHVAGIIGAKGLRVRPGLAGRCLVLPLRVLAAAMTSGSEQQKVIGVGSIADIDAGLKLAIDAGAAVVNMSLGTEGTDLDPHAEEPHGAIARYAEALGVVLVAAAGNSGRKQAVYPAVLPAVIAVGAMEVDGRRSDFSTYGDHLALCAPGRGVISVGRRRYRRSTGTSHAAPFVAATAALLITHARRRGVTLSARQVRELLEGSADRLGRGGDRDIEVGAGMLNAAGALRRLDEQLERGRAA